MPVYTDKQLDNMSIKQREQIKFYLHDIQTVQYAPYKAKRVNNCMNSCSNADNLIQPYKK